MASIYIRIGHENDLVITQLRNVKIVAIAFRKSTAKSIDHGLDLCIRQYLVHGSLLHIQDLTTDRQDRLVHPVPGSFGRTACGISLDDEYLAFFCITALAVGQFAVAVKGKPGLRQHIGLCLLLCLPNLGRLFRTSDNAL